jgi:hypothetical protein
MFNKTMKKDILKPLVIICLVGTLGGCGSLKPYDGVARSPKQNIDVYESGREPARPYKVIMSFSDHAGPGEEAKFHRDFVAEAQRLGADAIIFKPTQTGGWSINPFGGGNTSVFSAIAVVYQ